MNRERRDTGSTRRRWYTDEEHVPTPLPQLFRNVLILVNYQPSIEAIQTRGRTNVIDSAIRDSPYGNPWLNLRAIFTFAELIGPERILLFRLSDLHETLTDKIHDTWHISLPNDFFTFRFKDAEDRTYDVPTDTRLYPMLELHRPQWNRQQHVTGGNPPIPFDVGLSQPYILRLTAHHEADM